MYRWIFIFLMLPVVAMGQSQTPTLDTFYRDSTGIDADNDGTFEAYLYPTYIQKGANITLTVAGDTVLIAGSAGTGTADSMGVDTDGNGTIDAYLYSKVAGAFHIKKGANITLTVAGDTVTVAGPAGSGTADSIGVDTNGDGTVDNYLYSTVGQIATFFATGAGAISFTVVVDTLKIAITNQGIKKNHIDSTSSDVVFDDPFKGTSAEADSELATLEYAQVRAGDSARVAAGDSVATALRLAGGTMAGNIVMDNYNITGADVISADSIIIGEDTLYNEHLIAYLTRLRVRNASGATLTAGTPVYISGITGNRPNVDSARADNAALMPAIGLIEHDISSSADGFVVISGEFGPYNTLAWSVQDPLYVDATGGLTSTKPTGTNLIQKVGIVTRDNVAVGTIQLVGAGRTNDLPNIASANFWIGDASAVPTAVTMSGDATMDNAGAVTVSDVDTSGTKIAAALGFRMLNVGDTVTGTYNFSGNPLEFIRMIDFDDTITAPSYLEGRFFYDKTDNCFAAYNNEADITLNIGQEGWVYARNITGSTILDGKVVYITGAVSSRPTIALAQADAEATSKLIGVATHDIETASNGFVTIWGVVRGINLSDFTDGDDVFLSAAVAGSLTTTAPSAPNYVVEVGSVIDASANGDLFVAIGKSKMLNSLGDVLVSGPTTGDILVYDGTVWADTNTLTAASPNFTGTTTGDSAQFDGMVDMDSTTVNGVATFSGTTTLGTVAGAIDAGSATSLEIPNSDAPTTNAEGEIAWDTNDDAIEVYSGDESESVLLPIYKHITAAIPLPDSIQTYVPNLIIFHVNSLVYPAGIEIDLVSIQLESDAAYSMVIEEWSGADPPVLENIISTVTTGGTDTYAEEAPDNDGVLDAGDRIVLNIPTTDVDVVTVAIYFHIYDN